MNLITCILISTYNIEAALVLKDFNRSQKYIVRFFFCTAQGILLMLEREGVRFAIPKAGLSVGWGAVLLVLGLYIEIIGRKNNRDIGRGGCVTLVFVVKNSDVNEEK